MIDRATHRTVIMRRLTPSLKAGVEINPRADEVGLVANWRALSETATRPAVVFGTSSDRIGTPSGQAWFVTLSKSLRRQLGVPVAPYVGLSYSGHEDRFVVPFGVNVSFGRGLSAIVMNDGVHTHFGATYVHGRISLTALAVERQHLGFTIGTTF